MVAVDQGVFEVGIVRTIALKRLSNTPLFRPSSEALEGRVPLPPVHEFEVSVLASERYGQIDWCHNDTPIGAYPIDLQRIGEPKPSYCLPRDIYARGGANRKRYPGVNMCSRLRRFACRRASRPLPSPGGERDHADSNVALSNHPGRTETKAATSVAIQYFSGIVQPPPFR